MVNNNKPSVDINSKLYQWPIRPVIVICVDGLDPEYLNQAIDDNIIPTIKQFMDNGFHTIADSVIPSLTNPNNMSIITGAPQSVHGISGNYYMERTTGQEIMMNKPEMVRCESILSAFSSVGAKVVAVTAKEKLRALLGKDIDLTNGSVVFSCEKADECTLDINGITNVLEQTNLPLPNVYSAELSLFAFEAAWKILESKKPDIMYISTTDYIQHKYPPGSQESNTFLKHIDYYCSKYYSYGATVGITADHGMSDKARDDSSPNVIYLQDELDRKYGTTYTKVILPITDPYIVHHGSLGGFARVYCSDDSKISSIKQFIGKLVGIENVYCKTDACEQFDLPMDIEADLIAISDSSTAIGGSISAHDLTQLGHQRLRSHGGLAESKVPFVISHPLKSEYFKRSRVSKIRNYEIFDYTINGVQ